MKSTSLSSFFCYSIAGFLTLYSTHAQLLSCNEIGCPVDSYAQSTCYINGSHITTLGFSNFTTSLIPEPLSWTVGYKFARDDFHGNGTDERFYYLGTPPALDLNLVSSFTGYALFFVGIQAGLSFLNQNSSVLNLDPVSGTCGDALGKRCVSNLVQQSLNYTNNLNGNSTFKCSSLAGLLENNPPASCKAADTTWGAILAKDLTGPKVAPDLEIYACHPTIDHTYQTRMIENQSSISQVNFFHAVTPILTVFAPNSDPRDSDVGPTVTVAEAHLSCMKPVSDNMVQDVGSIGTSDGGMINRSSVTRIWLLPGLSVWLIM